MALRPAGALCSGCRRIRQAAATSSRGAAQASWPITPTTRSSTTEVTGPSRCHQTADAASRAPPITSSPMPSRAQRRVEVARPVTDASDGAADQVGEPEPQATQRSTEGQEDERERPRTSRTSRRARRRRAARPCLGTRRPAGPGAPGRPRGPWSPPWNRMSPRWNDRGRRRGPTTRRRARAGRAGGGAAGHPVRLSARPTHPRDLSRPKSPASPRDQSAWYQSLTVSRWPHDRMVPPWIVWLEPPRLRTRSCPEYAVRCDPIIGQPPATSMITTRRSPS